MKSMLSQVGPHRVLGSPEGALPLGVLVRPLLRVGCSVACGVWQAAVSASRWTVGYKA